MRTSTDHILTSHVGSLPRPDELIAANRARDAGEAIPERDFQQTLSASVTEVVRRQHEVGIDVPGDGEFGKSMAQRVNYGSGGRSSGRGPPQTAPQRPTPRRAEPPRASS